jgi:general secretion pathway protein C
LYAVGSELADGARLESVFIDRVLIARNGRTETLSLPHTGAGLGSAIAAMAVTSEIAQATDAPTRLREVPDQAPMFGGALRSQPVVNDDGQLQGLHIISGRGGLGAVADLGLELTDVVKAVNGKRLDNPADAAAAMEVLASAQSATVLVVRNGREQQLTLDPSRVGAGQP